MTMALALMMMMTVTQGYQMGVKSGVVPKRVLTVTRPPPVKKPQGPTKKAEEELEMDLPLHNARYEAETGYPELAKEYWCDPRIHGFGNTGWGGILHAFVAPAFTAMLDAFAYDGKDVRAEAWDLIKNARDRLGLQKITRGADLGCGTGFTSRSFSEYFDASVIGVDTSKEMLRAAKDMTGKEKVQYKQGNAETTGLPAGQYDVVTAAFVFHECPRRARHAILDEAFRLLAPGGTIAILDIAPNYKPSRFMLPGEPYLHGYLDNFDEDCSFFADKYNHVFAKAFRDVIVKNRLNLWHFHAKKPAAAFPIPVSPYFDVKV